MATTKTAFAGDRKTPLRSPLAALEKRFIAYAVDRVPRRLETYHLTLTTVLWSLGVVLCCWLARDNRHWLWLASLMLVLQWLTDALDGAVGRRRNTGLIKWGFYMDHFLDFIFISAVIAGYSFLVGPAARPWLTLLIPLVGAFWVHAFLMFSATNEFTITYLGVGPTEIRLLFVLLNTLVIAKGPGLLDAAAGKAVVVITLLLSLVVWRGQRQLWRLDMQAKKTGAAVATNR